MKYILWWWGSTVIWSPPPPHRDLGSLKPDQLMSFFSNNSISYSLLACQRTLMCELSFPTESRIVLSKQKTLEKYLTDWLPSSDLFQALSNWANGYFCRWRDRSWRPSEIPISNGDRIFQTIVWNGFFVTFLVVTSFHPLLYKRYVILPTRDSAVSVEKNNV